MVNAFVPLLPLGPPPPPHVVFFVCVAVVEPAVGLVEQLLVALNRHVAAAHTQHNGIKSSNEKANETEHQKQSVLDLGHRAARNQLRVPPRHSAATTQYDMSKPTL